MNLTDRLHCPDCQGRLSVDSEHALRCTGCGRTIPLVDGIADFVTGRTPSEPSDRYRGLTRDHGLLASGLPARIKRAAAGNWPAALGDTIEFGCGLGDMTHAILAAENVRSLLVIDSDFALIEACRARLGTLDATRPASFAVVNGGTPVLRDAIADTFIGTVLLSGIGDTRAFLTMVHRILKTGGRAAFVVPNRRYHQVAGLALAEALTLRYARDGSWPEGSWPALSLLAEIRRLLVHKDDPEFLNTLDEKHLFDSDRLEELGHQIGFATAEVIALDPDPSGGETITRLCQDAGAPEDFAHSFGPLAATIGQPYLNLLGQKDSSAFSLLWLTKAIGPAVRIFTSHPPGPPVTHIGPDFAVGGIMPRWSIELLARDTPDGVLLTVGGWCLSNIDTLWVRITLDGVPQHAPVWRHRPDVHEVLNRARIYRSLNALCSGVDGTLLFPGVHPVDGGCALRLEIVLSGGLVVAGPAPERLIIDEPMVVAH